VGDLSLTVLGCDGSYPGPGGAGSGYLVRAGGINVWVDAGPGTLANLQNVITIEEIDAIVISHQHVDHWSDLEHLAVASHYIIQRPDIPLYCVTDVTDMMRIGPAAKSLVWNRITADSRVGIGPMTFTFSRTDHPVDTLAVRVDSGGRSLGYSADSGPGWGLSELGPDLDLALCEATFLADREGTLPHMSARQAGESARAAGVGRLVLTHLLARTDREAAIDEGVTAFGRPVELAEIGKRYEV
jgi:ribonuclease BN (tRNA processing enzyme)